MKNLRGNEARRDRALTVVAAHYGLTPEILLGDDRHVPIGEARQVLYWLLREDELTLVAIGRLCNRDHSTVSTGLKTITARAKVSSSLRLLMTECRMAYRGSADVPEEWLPRRDTALLEVVHRELIVVMGQLAELEGVVKAIVERGGVQEEGTHGGGPAGDGGREPGGGGRARQLPRDAGAAGVHQAPER